MNISDADLTSRRLAEAIALGRELLEERMVQQEEELRQLRDEAAARRAEAWEPWYRRFISGIPDWALPYADDPRRPDWAGENVGWYQENPQPSLDRLLNNGMREMMVNGYVQFPDGTTIGARVPVSDGRASLTEAWFPVVWECATDYENEDEGLVWAMPVRLESGSLWLSNAFLFEEAVALAAEANNYADVVAEVVALNALAQAVSGEEVDNDNACTS